MNFKKLNMNFKKLENETTSEWVERLSNNASKCVDNIEKIKMDMKKSNVTGFCSKCGCNIYNGKHEC